MNKMKHESGAVIPLVAVMLLTVFAFLALSIDVSFLTGSTVEYKRIADSIALEVLKEYQESDFVGSQCNSACTVDTSNCGACADCQPLRRLCDSIKAAGNVANYNFTNSFSESRFETRAANYSDKINIDDSSDADTIAKITPGVWYFEHSDDDSTIPDNCYTDSSNKSTATFVPCFRALSMADVQGDADVTAFRIDVSTPENNQLRTLLGGFLGSTSAGLGASSTAAIVPRRGVFVVDTTSSAVTESHPFDSDSGTTIFQSYAATNSDCSTFYQPPEDSVGFINLYWQARLPDGPLADEPDKTDYLNARGSSTTTSCFPVPYTSAGNADNGSSKLLYHRIDTVNRPEPLADILLSVNQALRSFSARGVGGDRVGFIGFDNELIDVRSTWDITSNTPFSLIKPVESNNPEFSKILRATSPEFGDENNNGILYENWDEYTSKFLFPRYWSDSVAGSERITANTNIPDALEKARLMLSNSFGFRSADNFVVVFSDAQSNCRGGNFNSPNTDDCGFNRGDYRKSYRDFSNKVLSRYLEGQVALHFVLIGESSRPHSRLYSKDGSNCNPAEEDCCLSQTEYQQRKLRNPATFNNDDWVRLSNSDINKPYSGSQGAEATFPSFEPNVWQKATESTNGLWLPVRPPCSDFVKNGISDKKKAAAEAISFACTTVSKNSRAEFKNSNSALRNKIKRTFKGSNGKIRSTVLDDRGRLLCDPESRTIEEQIVQAIQDEILKISPFVLVE